MPVYEYQCKACGRDFEYQQRMSDPDKTTCEVCGGQLDRLISRTAFALKGGGWYKDLYASPKPEGGKTETGGDAKPAVAADKPAATADTAAAAPAAKSSDSGTSGSSGGGSSGGSSSGSSSPGSSGSSSAGSVTKAS